MKCPKTPTKMDGGDDLVLDVQCGTNTALVHLSKLRQGSRAASVLFEGRWLSPNQFQCVSGRRTTKDWKRSIRHHGKTLRQLMGQGVLTVDPPACDCASCKGNSTKENMSPDVVRVAGKAYESVETKDETTTVVAPAVGGSVVTVAATKDASVVSALLDKTRDTQQCARAMVVELPRRGDSKTQHKHAKADLATENEKTRDTVTSTTTPDSESVRPVAHEADKKINDGATVPDKKKQCAEKEEGRVASAPTKEDHTKEVVVTAATSFTDMFRAAQRSGGVSPPVARDVISAVSTHSDRANKAPTSPVAFHDVVSRKSPKTGSDRHTPEARLPGPHSVAQDADKPRVPAVGSGVTGTDARPPRLDALGLTGPSIYQFRALDNSVLSGVRPPLVESGHVTKESAMASMEHAVTATTSIYSGLMTSSLAASDRDSKLDHEADRKRSDDGKCRATTSLANIAKKHCNSREKSSSSTTTMPSGDRSEKRHSTSPDEYSPEKRQRHSLAEEHSPKHVTKTPERDTLPKHVSGSRVGDLKTSLNPWSELAEKSSYLGGVGLDWPLARSLYAALPYSSPAASLPGYCTGLCCNPYLGHVPGMPLLCGSTCQQPFCFSCYPMLPTKPLHGCLSGSLRQTLPSAAVTPCGMLCPSHPLGYGADQPQDTLGYLKLHEQLAGLAPSYRLASDAFAQSLAATTATSPAKRRHGSTEAGQRSKTKRKCGDVTLVERPLDLSVRN